MQKISINFNIPSSSNQSFSSRRKEQRVLEQIHRKERVEKDRKRKEVEIGNQGGPLEKDRKITKKLFKMTKIV